tara:strand:- start:3147 stop:4508 length:1362 start_codon:yes stop_codon:yes gene_type:complete
MNILSIYTSHDGSITYVEDNKIIFHTQIDRYNKFKHFSFPTKEIITELEKLQIDIIIISHLTDHCTPLWINLFKNSKKLKNIPLVYYGNKYHHLLHAYCSLTWSSNQNILVCDGNGADYQNGREQESYYLFDKNLQHVITESNNIGMDYELFTAEQFESSFDCGKTMAWSLHHELPRNVQNRFETKMNNLIHRFNIKQNLTFTGGCAQNVLYNTKLKTKFNKLFCDPFNGDFGISLGAANLYCNNFIRNNKIYLGIPQSLDLEIFSNHTVEDVQSTDVAEILVKEPVAIFQSRSEQGQRGLGNRSLLMNPMDKKANYKLNKIKKREWFRPFACSILEEQSTDWFDISDNSPHMMYVYEIKNDKKLEAGISIDNKSRLQTVSDKDNPLYHELIKSFYKITKVPLLINTSLNLPGEVLVETLYDLKKLFEQSSLNFIYFPEIKKLVKKHSVSHPE